MNWLQKWAERRRINQLKQRVARMKQAAAQAEIPPLMPALETISGRIRKERIVVLEKALEKIDPQPQTR